MSDVGQREMLARGQVLAAFPMGEKLAHSKANLHYGDMDPRMPKFGGWVILTGGRRKPIVST